MVFFGTGVGRAKGSQPAGAVTLRGFPNPGLDGSLKLEHATKSIISELGYQLIVHILSEVILGAISVHESGC